MRENLLDITPEDWAFLIRDTARAIRRDWQGPGDAPSIRRLRAYVASLVRVAASVQATAKDQIAAIKLLAEWQGFGRKPDWDRIIDAQGKKRGPELIPVRTIRVLPRIEVKPAEIVTPATGT